MQRRISLIYNRIRKRRHKSTFTMSDHNFRVAWLDSAFLVVDANQSVEMLLQLLEQIRPKWVVLMSRRQFFVFKSTELDKAMQGKHAARRVQHILKLTVGGASRKCSPSTRSTSAPTSEGAPGTRAGALNSRGEV